MTKAIWILFILFHGKEEAMWAFPTESACIEYAQTHYDLGVDQTAWCRQFTPPANGGA